MNRIIFMVWGFLTMLPYPYYTYLSFIGLWHKQRGDIFVSKALKDVLILFMLFGIVTQLQNRFRPQVLYVLGAMALALFLPALITLDKSEGAFRVLVGVRGLGYYFIPFLYALLLKPFQTPVRAITAIFWIAVAVTVVHTVIMQVSYATGADLVYAPYKSSNGLIRRAFGVYGDPTLMGAIFSLSAVLAFELKRYKTFLICLGLSLTTYSLTALTPLAIYFAFYLKSAKQRMAILAFMAVVGPFSAFARFGDILKGQDWSALGKLTAYIRTGNLWSASEWPERLFGRGYAINDAAGFFLKKQGINTEYFPAESTYNMFLTQYGLVFLSLYVLFMVYTVVKWSRIRHPLSSVFSTFLISVSIMSLGLQLFSFAQTTAIYAFIQGLLFNRDRERIMDCLLAGEEGSAWRFRDVLRWFLPQPAGAHARQV